jgi:hypothetical protein
MRGGGSSVSLMIAGTWCSGIGRLPVHHLAGAAMSMTAADTIASD